MSRKGKEPRTRVEVPPGGWATQGKTPRAPAAEQPRKTVRSLHVDSALVKDRHPVWRFADVDPDGSYAFGRITPDELTALLADLAAWESMTVGELFSPGGRGKKYEIASLPRPEIRARLVELERDDEDVVHVLRCAARPRLYGFLREHVFHVLWWDPNHEIWPSPKKRT